MKDESTAGLGGFLDFTVANARGTGANPLVAALDYRTDGLQVQIPTALSHVVRVADFVAELRSATADITYFGHGRYSRALKTGRANSKYSTGLLGLGSLFGFQRAGGLSAR